MSKTSRNAPCPCGSGLKYKKCCGLSTPSVLESLTPGVRMKGGVRSNPHGPGFVAMVHTWDNVYCRGEPDEWNSTDVFATEAAAMEYYTVHIRPSLQRLMAKMQKEQKGTKFIHRELE